MPTLHPTPIRPPQPSRYQDGYCEVDYCWTRDGVFYDHETHKHLCHAHWACRVNFPPVVLPALVLPAVGGPAKLVPIDRHAAARMRRPQ